MARTVAPLRLQVHHLHRLSYKLPPQTIKRFQLARAGVVAAPSLSLTKHEQDISINSGDPPPLCTLKENPPLVPIPVIDISLLSSEEGEEDDELEKLRTALTTWGCFQVLVSFFEVFTTNEH